MSRANRAAAIRQPRLAGPGQLSKFKDEVRRVRAAGFGLLVVLHSGDSTTRGYGAGSPGADDGAFDNSYPAKMADALDVDANLGDFEHTFDGICSSSSDTTAALYTAYNTNVVANSDWVPLFLVNATLGGGMWSCSSPLTSTFAFTPKKAFSSVRVIYGSTATGGLMKLAISGGAQVGASMNCGAGIGVFSADFTDVHGTGVAGTGTIELSRLSGGTVFIIAVIAWDASKKVMVHINAGRGGSTTPTYNIMATATGNYRPEIVLGVLRPALTIMNLGINDERAPTTTPPAYYRQNMQNFARMCLQYGSVILNRPYQISTVQATPIIMAIYTEQLKGIAGELNLMTFDSYSRYGAYTTWNPTYGYSDNLHMGAAGYADEGAWFAARLSAAMGAS